MILVACEESQAVTIELRNLGHEAYSCDIIECSGGHPEWHIMQDVLPLLNGNCTFKTCDGVEHSVNGKLDMIIAFPPCTHLSSSGQWAYSRGFKDTRLREDAVDFLWHLLTLTATKSLSKTLLASCLPGGENQIRSFTRGNSNTMLKNKLAYG